MARGRQRRKQQRQRAINADEHGGVAEELVEEADAPEEGEVGQDDSTLPNPSGEPQLSASDTVALIGPLRHSRSRRSDHPLVVGIRMFTVMLDEARGGYIIDRLSEVEEILGEEFNGLERDGIVQIASGNLLEDGVPDVDSAIRIALDARRGIEAEFGGFEDVAEDHGDTPADEEQDRIDEVREAEAAAAEENRAMAEQEEDFAPDDEGDGPGPDELPQTD